MQTRSVILNIACLALGFASGAVAYRWNAPPFDLLRSLHAPSDAIVSIPDNPHYIHRVSFFREYPTFSNVVMVGDSITEGADWQAVFPDVKISNRGIGYDTTAGALARIDTILATEAKTAFIMLGVNDFAQSDNVAAAFSQYSELITRLAPDMRVVVQSTLLASGNAAARNPYIQNLNFRLSSFCDGDRCSFIDLNSILAPNGFLAPGFSEDGIHLNGQGYRSWAEKIAPLMP